MKFHAAIAGGASSGGLRTASPEAAPCPADRANTRGELGGQVGKHTSALDEEAKHTPALTFAACRRSRHASVEQACFLASTNECWPINKHVSLTWASLR